MRILVSGATGFLGYRILEQLANTEFAESITAAGRTLKPSHTVIHPKVNYVLGNLEEEEYAFSLVKKTDLIVNAAALSSPWGKEADFIRANVKTQENLIKAGIYYNISRFIYISTPGVYFNSKDRFLIKESDPLPTKFINAYAKTKRDAEILLENSKIPYIILRPRALIGRGDTVIMPRLIRAYDEGKLKIIGTGKNQVDLTSVANVVQAVMLSIQANENALNQKYNISNGEPVALWESIEYVLTLLGKEMPRKKIPYSVALAVAHIMELKSKVTDFREPPLTKYGIGTLAKSFTMDISKAKELLKYKPEVTTKQAIEEFVKWHITNEGSKTISE